MHKANVTIKPPKAPSEVRKKRVAAYARVSSEKDLACNSLAAQISYYNDLIARHDDWEFVSIYADEGLTGTKDNRPEFQRMLEDCRKGLIDMILIKSVTRLARNTVTFLSTVRELIDLGVDVYCETENIHTKSMTGELIISLLAAVAQEESRSASLNRIWNVRKAYQQGKPVTGNAFGYRLKDGQFCVEDTEEEIVAEIFLWYLCGHGLETIARHLNALGVKTRFNKPWNANTVRYVLHNEKYTGDLLLQKYYVKDYLSKKLVCNHGEKPMYHVVDAHEAIIDHKTYDFAQQEFKRRAAMYYNGNPAQPHLFTGLLRCEKCGKTFLYRVNARGTKYAKPIWRCSTFNQLGKDMCDAQSIPEDILIATTKQLLGTEEVTSEMLHGSIKEIKVPEPYRLVYYFQDGSTQEATWQHRSRREAWTPEMRQKAAEYARKGRR